MVKPPGPRYIWFKLALAVGSVLGVLLLVESLITYYQVSETLVDQELQQQARWQATEFEREVTRLGIVDRGRWTDIAVDMQRQDPRKIAWIRVFEIPIDNLSQGMIAGPSFSPQQVRLAYERGAPVSEVQQTASGKVVVVLFAVRLIRGPAAAARPLRHFVEVALYWDSAVAQFRLLHTDMVISFISALGLVLSTALLWTRLPHYAHGKQLEAQTELARKVQADLLPPDDFRLPGLDFAARCVPAWQVGGDFYDAFLTENNRFAIVIGDVAGKGLPASVVAGLLLGAVHGSNWMAGAKEHERASRRLSELLRARTSPESFASLFWCYYEPDSQILRYINAGHPPPLLLRLDGSSEAGIESLQAGGPVMGILEGAEYRQASVAICPGDLLVFYSDGVVEAASKSEAEFGEKCLIETLRKNSSAPAAEICDEVLNRIRAFVGNQSAQDDITLIVARIRKTPRQHDPSRPRLIPESESARAAGVGSVPRTRELRDVE